MSCEPVSKGTFSFNMLDYLTNPYLLSKILSYTDNDAYAFSETCKVFHNVAKNYRDKRAVMFFEEVKGQAVPVCYVNKFILLFSHSYAAWAKSHPRFQYRRSHAALAVDLQLWDRLLEIMNDGCAINASTVEKLCMKRRKAELERIASLLDSRDSPIYMSYDLVEVAIKTGDVDYLKLVYRIGRLFILCNEDVSRSQQVHALTMLCVAMGNVDMLKLFVFKERLENVFVDTDWKGGSFCYEAVKSGNEEMLRYMLETALPVLKNYAHLPLTKFGLLCRAEESPNMVRIINEILN